MTLNYKIIGSRIKIRRKMKDVTQEQMAEDLNLSVGFISQLVRGICKVSLDTLANITEYLDCTFSDILEYNQHSESYNQSKLNALYSSLSLEDQHVMLSLMEAYTKHR